jgi:hypothetical protein
MKLMSMKYRVTLDSSEIDYKENELYSFFLSIDGDSYQIYDLSSSHHFNSD